MIHEAYFGEIQEKARQFKYSGFNYLAYEECCRSEVLLNQLDVIIWVNRHTTPAQIYFAADNFDLVIPTVIQMDVDIQINFVPQEYRGELARLGFIPWAEFVDFYNHDIAKTVSLNCDYEDIQFLQQEELSLVAALSQSCANQSRGFTGETKEWFLEWLIENDVIVVYVDDVMAGFCCVSIYNEGKSLWLREVGVAPAYQGQGLGRRLIEQAICYGHNKGAKKGFLAADVLNEKAIKLYNRYGFNTNGTDSELQMRKLI